MVAKFFNYKNVILPPFIVIFTIDLTKIKRHE